MRSFDNAPLTLSLWITLLGPPTQVAIELIVSASATLLQYTTHASFFTQLSAFLHRADNHRLVLEAMGQATLHFLGFYLALRIPR